MIFFFLMFNTDQKFYTNVNKYAGSSFSDNIQQSAFNTYIFLIL